MADGKEWTTQNLNVATEGSFCYADAEVDCRRYGRLYTWESARKQVNYRAVGGDFLVMASMGDWKATDSTGLRIE